MKIIDPNNKEHPLYYEEVIQDKKPTTDEITYNDPLQSLNEKEEYIKEEEIISLNWIQIEDKIQSLLKLNEDNNDKENILISFKYVMIELN